MPTIHARFPDNLVQHTARELLARATLIKLLLMRVREISCAPLPIEDLRAGFGAQSKIVFEQWQMGAADSAPRRKNPNVPLWQKLNPFAASTHELTTLSWMQWEQQQAILAQEQNPHLAAQLVLAPLVLDGWDAAQVLDKLNAMPAWFAADGVLLFAVLGAGSCPELVNREPAWLTHFTHLPDIMAMGQRLQTLRFGLPVLDTETVRLGYDRADILWADLCQLSPSLRCLPSAEQTPWRVHVDEAFTDGLRELSLSIIYGQVWQPQPAMVDDGVRTVSLDQLAATLPSARQR